MKDDRKSDRLQPVKTIAKLLDVHGGYILIFISILSIISNSPFISHNWVKMMCSYGWNNT